MIFGQKFNFFLLCCSLKQAQICYLMLWQIQEKAFQTIKILLLYTVKPLLTDTSIIRTPLYYGQFVLSQKCQKSYIPYLYNTATSVKRTLSSVPLVSILKRFDCSKKICIFRKDLTYDFGQKFLDYKNVIFTQSKNLHFSKGVIP